MPRANEQAYEYIKEKILSGEYKPAQRIVEYRLADEIGVSRNTIKKALLRLEQEKLLIVEDNKGSVVRSMDMAEVIEYLEIREALELIIITHAIQNITSEDIALLEETLEKMKLLAKDGDLQTYSENNRKFHKVIYNAAHHEITTDMILEIKNQMLKFQIRTMNVPGRAKQSLQEHENILEAIKKRDLEQAKAATSAHLHGVLQTAIKFKALLF